MQRKIVAAAMVAGLLFAGVACSSDSGGGDSTQAQLADKLQEAASQDGTDISDDEANCISEAMINLAGEDNVQQALDSGEDSMDSLLSEDQFSDDPQAALDFLNKLSDCAPELMGEITGGGSGDGSDSGSGG